VNSSILVVEDNPITRRMMRFALESEGYEVMEAGGGGKALELLATLRPDLILQDYVLPDMDGLSLLEGIRALPGQADLPVLLVTGMISQIEELRGRTTGPTSILPKPLEPSRLIDVVRSHLSRGTSSLGGGRRLLVVDDELVGRRLAAFRLRDAGFEVETAGGAEEALRTAEVWAPHAVLADVLMPGMDGFELCRALRDNPRFRHLPVVLLSSAYAEEADRKLAQAMGANALLVRTPDMRDAIEALVLALRGREAPAPAAGRQEVAALHAQRVQAQLDKQFARNEALLRQGAIQAAALSVVRGLAMALASPRDVASVLGDVLVHCLDAAGLSTGLLYLARPGGELRLQTQAGVLTADKETAARCFGHPEVLQRILDGGEPVACLFESETDPALRELGKGLGQASGLLIPFVVADERIGVLVLAADSQDLSEPVWTGFGRALAAQFGQTIALGRFLARGVASEARYRSLMEQANDAILLLDDSGIVEANRQAEVLLGRPRADIVKHRYEEFVAPEEAGEASEASLPPADGPNRVGVRSLLRPDGARVPVEASGSMVQIGDERLRLLILRDVTERERMERKLRESEEQYRLLFESNPHPMWVYDPQTLAFLAVNDAAVGLYGYSREEFVDMTVKDIRPAEEVSELPHPPGRSSAQVFRHRRKDGSTLDAEVASSAILLRGTPARLALVTDVSEKRRLEAQLLQVQKMEAVGRLAGGVAHDFNNLLGVITGYSELLHRELGAGHRGQARVQAIQGAAEHAAALTRQLLAFSRRGVIEPKVLDLDEVVSDIENMLRRLIGEDVQMTLALGGEGGRIRADRGQIDQVIMNLVVNARDAMPEGGRLAIETSAVTLDEAYARTQADVRPGPYVLLAVRDTGHGMDAVTQAHIFEPFFTTKEEGKGTGLGLATVFGIVKRSGGHVTVQSEPGAGATFKVYLPRVDQEIERVEPPPVTTPSPRGSETILVVEDAPALRAMIREILEGNGYHVLEASRPEEALAAAKAHHRPVDLVVTDVVMPGMSGPELVARLRRDSGRARVLYMSGYTDEAIGSRRVHAPGTQFLPKPFTVVALLGKVREALEARRD
jgi:PAS domain S-box-containing protein